MNIEKDPNAVEWLAALKEDENWQFRLFLKGLDVPEGTLDDWVQNFSRDVSSAIDCTACGHCCKIIWPVLDEADIRRMARGLGYSEEGFFKAFLKKDPEGEVVFKTVPCPFQKDNRCSCYDLRPEVCRSYPHFQLGGFSSRLIKVVQNCSVCPIVYHVYERLKLEFEEPFRQFLSDMDLLEFPE